MDDVKTVNELKLRSAFSEALNIAIADIDDRIAYDQTKGWDSVAHMALIAAIDAGFDIMLDTDDVLDLSSYSKAKEILQKYGVQL